MLEERVGYVPAIVDDGRHRRHRESRQKFGRELLSREEQEDEDPAAKANIGS